MTARAESISALKTSDTALEARVAIVEKSNAELLEKLISFEDRSHRNNIRVVGLPEGAEGSNPTKFIQSFLQKTFEQEFPSPPEIDRAHRTGPQPPAGGNPPHTLSFHQWALTFLDIVYLELSTARLHGAREDNVNIWSHIAEKIKEMV